MTLTFVHGDHLGSASLTTGITGTKVSEMRYYPFGEVRYSSGSTPTDRTFTGQMVEPSGLGSLMDYNAREYSPLLGRFLSADTIVPNPTNPNSLNRYSYVENSPIQYNDPSGFCRHDSQGNFVYAEDCTLEEYQSLSWNERITWVQMFQKKNNVDWFDNVVGILEYFRDDSVLGKSGWASLSDAGVLLAIQDGYRTYKGGSGIGSARGFTSGENAAWQKASELWNEFYFDYYHSLKPRDDMRTFSKWGLAEQAGVDFGIQLADAHAVATDNLEQARIDTFVYFGNIYRGIISSGSKLTQWEPIDTPWNSHVFVYYFSILVVSPRSYQTYQIAMDIKLRQTSPWYVSPSSGSFGP